MEKGPVFIGGVERSGTSLLYALLASHPNLAMTRRTNLWPYFYNQYGDLNQPENVERLFKVMRRYRRLHVINLDFDLLFQEFCQGERSYIRLFTLLWEQVARTRGKPRWGDKSLNTERYADLIFASYPGARLLHIVRDPRDRYASALKRWKKIRGGAGSGTAMWLASVAMAERNLERYPDQYMVVRYESLAEDPENTLKKVCAFIDEEYTPAMLSMKGAEAFRDTGGNSSFEPHETGRISSRSIGRFRKALPQRAIAFMQAVAGREMNTYGYAPEPLALSLSERLVFSLVDLPLNLLRVASWNAREAYLDRKGRPIPADRILKEAA
jgi:hypothetical protein